jgi:ankyrin repeat protein
MFAAQNGHSQIVELLLRNGADENIKDNNNKTALDHAMNEQVRNTISTF